MRVLIALDTSEIGESAVEAIGAWARSIPIEVSLLSVVHGDETREQSERQTSEEFVRPEAAAAGDVLGMAGSVSSVDATVADPLTIEDRGQALTRARSQREDYLREVAARRLPDGNATVHVEFSDATADSIVATAKSLGVDAIAMATHGRTGLRHVVMGSVAEVVMRQSHVPVIVVGPQVHAPNA